MTGTTDAGWRGRLRYRTRDVWMSVRWPLLAVLAAGSLILGHIGFHEHLGDLGEPRPFTRSLYLSIQLFVLESGAVPPPTPWTLEVARLAAPATTLVSALSALAAVFREEWGRVRLRFLRGHVVVCGLGERGSLLVRSFRRRGDRVVAVELDPRSPSIAAARTEGAVVITGDASNRDLWGRLRVGRAWCVVSVCGDDATNVEVAAAVRSLAGGRLEPLRVFAHVADPGFRELLQAGAVAIGGDCLVEYFSVDELGAGLMLARTSLRPMEHDRGLHVAVVGLGPLGVAITLRLARWWTGGSRVRLTIIDAEATATADALVARHQGLGEVADIRPFDASVGSAGFLRLAFLEGDAPDLDAAYVCSDEEATSLAAAAILCDRTGGRFPIVARVARRISLADPAIIGFSLLEETCSPETLLGGIWERLARAIHADYVRCEEEAGHTADDNPSMAAWDRLPGELKASNRAQAADMGMKLASIGCEIVPGTQWGAPLVRLEPEEVERLARMEHDRWASRLFDDGWRYAPGEKDPSAKTHPDLVPYEELSEAEREADRSAVRGMPAFLEAVGLHVRRTAS